MDRPQSSVGVRTENAVSCGSETQLTRLFDGFRNH
jgi:hypothetical protein